MTSGTKEKVQQQGFNFFMKTKKELPKLTYRGEIDPSPCPYTSEDKENWMNWHIGYYRAVGTSQAKKAVAKNASN